MAADRTYCNEQLIWRPPLLTTLWLVQHHGLVRQVVGGGERATAKADELGRGRRGRRVWRAVHRCQKVVARRLQPLLQALARRRFFGGV